MTYWLIKSEPQVFGVDDLAAEPRKTAHWDGVRNYQARNMIRDEMKHGDKIFFYHSSCPEPGIVGVARVAREAYPDHTAFDPNDPHYDPKSDPDDPRWFMFDVKLVRVLKRPILLSELRKYSKNRLSGLRLLQRGNRLSVLPVQKRHWDFILTLE